MGIISFENKKQIFLPHSWCIYTPNKKKIEKEKKGNMESLILW